MKLDRVHTIAEIKQFAAQLKHFNEAVIKELEAAFANDHKSVDFYVGMPSGLSSSYVVLKGDQALDKRVTADKLEALIASTAKSIEDRV